MKFRRRDVCLKKNVFAPFFIGLIFTGQMFLLWPLTAEGTSFSSPTSFQFIYIDANVGGSSGGHSALRIGNTVYHFQYFPDGLFKLVRERWPYFRYIYNDLENRTLYVANIQIEYADLQTLQESLDRCYLIQKAHMDRLEKLSQDLRLLDDLTCGHFRMSLNGAGLFSVPSPPDDISAQLRLAVIDVYGKNFLSDTMKSLDRDLLKITPVAPKMAPTDIKSDVYPPWIVSFAGDYSENRLKRTALDILEQALPVQENALTHMGHFARPGDPKGLTPNEREKLSAYAETLKTSVIQLPSSSRPDWGYPLLLANARYQVVMRSLERNSLYLLDPFPESAKAVSQKTVQEDSAVTAKLADRAREKYWDIRRSAFAEASLDERSYNRLEESAGRFAELEKGRLTRNVIRVAYGRLIPSRPGMVPLPRPKVSKEDFRQALRQTRVRRTLYYDQLKRCYPYDLISDNCATELMGKINDPFQDRQRVTEVLGGEIVPGEGLSFIPFRLFDLVKDHLRVTDVQLLPGYRKRVLLSKAQNEPENRGLYFRECNTLTSTLYNHVPGDTPFLFFTDDVVWIRPLYGAVNGAYGLLTAALGIFTLPVDGGDLSLAGLKGTLYSLPELFFFNIRKGSFNYVDDPGDSQIDTLERSAPAFDRKVYP